MLQFYSVATVVGWWALKKIIMSFIGFFMYGKLVVMTNFTELESTIRQALVKVIDPEIGKSITELGMLRNVTVHEDYKVTVDVDLTTSACPLRTTIADDVKKVVLDIPGVSSVEVEFGVMTDAQRSALRKQLRGERDEVVIPFSQAHSRTRVFAVASGKGGVGKSTVTVNLATGFAAKGLKVGIVDADVYGHSIPDMMGSHAKPTQVDTMIMPPMVNGIKVISIAQFTKGNSPVVWRGPMLHRALQQFLADVFWGDLDILLLDLPPGTGDMAISVAQLIPTSELLVVTTPQQAAAHVAERAGALVVQTKQKIVGVIENMSAMRLPNGERLELFGSGGGQTVADRLTQVLGVKTPLLGSIPLDPILRQAGDEGVLLGLDKDAPLTTQEDTSKAISDIVDKLMVRQKSLVGMSLGIDTVRK